MHLNRRLLIGSRAGAGVAKIIGGTLIGNLLALGAAPLLTRLYSPADFGTLAVVTATAMVLTAVLTLRVELAIPIATHRPALALTLAGLCSGTILGVSISLCLWALRHVPATEEQLHRLTPSLWTAPLLAMTMAWYTVLNATAVRDGQYGKIAARNIIMAVTTLAIQLVIGCSHPTAAGLIAGQFAGQAVGALTLLRGSNLLDLIRDSPTGVAREVAQALAKYRHFPLALGPAGILNLLGLQAPTLIVAGFYSPAVVGWYGFTQRVLALPVTLIGASVAQVYLGELARSIRERHGNQYRQFMRATRILATAALCSSIPVLLWGPQIFSTIFGAHWRQSGEFARALSPLLAAQLIASPLSQTLVAFQRNFAQLSWDAARLAAVATCAGVTGALGASAIQVAWSISTSMAGMYVISWMLSRRAVLTAEVALTDSVMPSS